MDIANFIDSLKAQAGNISMSSSAAKAGVIVALLFLLLLVMAKMSRGYMSWYTSGWWLWTGLGFLLAVVIEGLFIVGGTTISTALLTWESAPEPVQNVLDTSRERLTGVLGEQSSPPTADTMVTEYKLLDKTSQTDVRLRICLTEDSEE